MLTTGAPFPDDVTQKRYDRAEILEVLIKYGAKLRTVTPVVGQSPMHVAAREGSFGCAQILLHAAGGAPPAPAPVPASEPQLEELDADPKVEETEPPAHVSTSVTETLTQVLLDTAVASRQALESTAAAASGGDGDGDGDEIAPVKMSATTGQMIKKAALTAAADELESTVDKTVLECVDTHHGWTPLHYAAMYVGREGNRQNIFVFLVTKKTDC